MRKMFLTLIVTIAVTICGWAGERNGGENDNAVAEDVVSFLFVGVKDYNVSSNYYTNGQIAEYLSVPERDVVQRFNDLFCKAFNESIQKKNLRLTACNEKAAPIVSNLIYDRKNGITSSNISMIDRTQYRNTLEHSDAQYLLVCDQYNVMKVDYPYENFSHIIHYTVFDTAGQKIYDGCYQYAALDLGNTDMLEKQLRRAADKFIKAVF